MTFPVPLSPLLNRRRRTAFTLVEVMIASSLTAFLLIAAFSGVVSLQKSYAATESYGIGLADQMRMLDYLALDLRRAVATTSTVQPWVVDTDGQGLKITVPDYYCFNQSDPQHLYPIANDPIYNSTLGIAYYTSGPAATANTLPSQVIAYRYTNGTITRSDPWQPLVSNGMGGYKAADPAVIATSMDTFPTITPDTSDSSGGTLRYQISFYSSFQPFATHNSTDTITLHNVTFIRSKNLSR